MNDALTMGIGVLIGALLAASFYERSFRLASRYYRTGNTEPPTQNDVASRITTASPEATAMRHVTEDAVNKGAEQLMAAAHDAGIPLSRKDALANAREMIASSGEFGGAR